MVANDIIAANARQERSGRIREESDDDCAVAGATT
jgi:hypothetical protein